MKGERMYTLNRSARLREPNEAGQVCDALHSASGHAAPSPKT